MMANLFLKVPNESLDSWLPLCGRNDCHGEETMKNDFSEFHTIAVNQALNSDAIKILSWHELQCLARLIIWPRPKAKA
jgi:hypothetical protein